MSSTGIGVGASMIFGGVKASPSFEYSGSAFCADASDPTPTINGTPGGTFTAAPVAPNTGTLVINSSTGTVDLSASDVGNYLVTYTVAGKSESDPFEVLAIQSTAFSYTASSFQQTGTASPTITGTSGGVFSATSGIIFSDTSSNTGSSTGVINLAASTIGGPYTITYTNTGACQGTPSTFDVSITAAYASTSSFSFDGANDYFDIGNPTELQLTNNISVSGWFKTSSSSIMNMFTKRATGVNNWSVYMQSGKIYFWVSVDGSSVPVQIISATTLNDDNWHFFAGVREGTSLKLYIDNLTAVTGTIASGSLTNPNGTVMIGKASVNNFLWSGNIDELAIWDTNLSSAAVTEIYNSGAPNDLTSLTNASSSNLKAWYKMGE